ncbi:hypothetical protein [Scytonema sp. NUACC21]
MSPEIYKPTDVQLQRWAENDELEKFASAGILSDSEQERLINAFFDTNHLHNHLEKVRANKQELLRKLAYLEEREQLLLAEIKRQEASSSNIHQNQH